MDTPLGYVLALEHVIRPLFSFCENESEAL